MYLGDSKSTKVIYEFVDYNCGYCQKFHQELINVMSDNSLKLVIIQMPIFDQNWCTIWDNNLHRKSMWFWTTYCRPSGQTTKLASFVC